MSDKRFFEVDDGGCSYSIVARDLEHAKQLLRDAHVEFTDEDGDTAPIDDPRFVDIEWIEISAEKAAENMITDDDGLARTPLSETSLGDFFCSEF